MAAKRTTRKTRKKRSTRRKTARGLEPRKLLSRIDRELSGLAKQIDRTLAPWRRELAKAEKQAGREAARLLREARRRLDKVEIGGQADWQKFLRQRRGEISKALSQLERTVRPKPRRKPAARKKKAPARASAGGPTVL